MKADTPPGYRTCRMPDGPFAEVLGPLYIREDGAGFAFRATGLHCNARGVVHGGMLMTFADQTLGLTVQRALDRVRSRNPELRRQGGADREWPVEAARSRRRSEARGSATMKACA